MSLKWLIVHCCERGTASWFAESVVLHPGTAQRGNLGVFLGLKGQYQFQYTRNPVSPGVQISNFCFPFCEYQNPTQKVRFHIIVLDSPSGQWEVAITDFNWKLSQGTLD